MVLSETISESFQAWLSSASDFVGQVYAQEPVLVLAVSVLLALPALILLGVLLRSRRRFVGDSTNTTLLHRGTKQDAANITGRTVLPVTPPRPLSARLEIPGPKNSAYGLNGREMVRLGREDDNDVCLDDSTVHRYHAVIQRSVDAGYIISDISTQGGNGVFVNGKRTREARLEDGDEINLGTARLVFRLETPMDVQVETLNQS